jgi:DNA gyrase subunit B
MQEVIDRGYLFIAQPPLFKVSQGKKDVYLKDETEKTVFLLKRIAESVEVTPVAGMAVKGEALTNMLQRMEEYRNHGRKLQSRGVPREALDVLFLEGFHDRTALADPERRVSLEAALRARGFEHVRQMTDPDTETPIIEFMAGGNGTGKRIAVTNELLSQYEFRQMGRAFEQLSAFGLPPYTIAHGEGTTAFTRIDDLLEEIYKLAEKGLTIQRYKGLGEMNPEQLWETTLNPDTRRMLPVMLDDGVDVSVDIFNMMMSRENASQRREWMETYGNLVDADIS